MRSIEEASRLFVQGSRDPELLSFLKNASDSFNWIWYDDIEISSVKVRLNFVLDRIRNRKRGSILEVASWSGVFANEYTKMGFEVTCLDGNYAVGELCRQLGAYKFIYGKIDDVRIYKKYDIICALEILEHLIDPESVVRKLKEALTDDGILLVSVPVETSVFNGFSPEDYPGGEHINMISIEDFRRWGMTESFTYSMPDNKGWHLGSYDKSLL